MVTTARSNQGHTLMLHTYTTPGMFRPSMNFLQLMVFEIYPRQDFKGHGHFSLVKGQNQDHTMTLHIYTPLPMSLASINFLHLMVSEILPGQGFFLTQGHLTARSKVKSRSHHVIAHLQRPTNIRTNYQLPTHYDF